MTWLAAVGWMVAGAILGAIGLAAVFLCQLRRRSANQNDRTLVSNLIKAHFQPRAISNITISEGKFPFRVRADLQKTIDRPFD